MKVKVIIITGMIIGILALSFFGSSIKEEALKGIAEDIPQYNCGTDNICTSCIIGGYTCSCGEHTCSCGNETVDKAECEIL